MFKYLYYCMNMWKLSKLCQSEWHRKNHAGIFCLWKLGEGDQIIKQVAKVSIQQAHLIYFVLI